MEKRLNIYVYSAIVGAVVITLEVIGLYFL